MTEISTLSTISFENKKKSCKNTDDDIQIYDIYIYLIQDKSIFSISFDRHKCLRRNLKCFADRKIHCTILYL